MVKLDISPESSLAQTAASANLRSSLASATASQRSALLLNAVALHSAVPFQLPADRSNPVSLAGVDLSPAAVTPLLPDDGSFPTWWDPELQRVVLHGINLQGANLSSANLASVDLREANLMGARLTEANLEGALLEQANLEGADLLGARLNGASLGSANLTGAMLEDALLNRAKLRFATLTGAVFEHAQLEGADLWGAHADGANFTRANLKNSSFHETKLNGANLVRANLQDAVLSNTILRAADLTGADLQGAVLTGADLEGARLTDARLQGLVLTHSNIAHIHLAGARLDKTELEQPMLRGSVGEEVAHQYEPARRAYLALERNFLDLGDQDAANWAYARKRRMQKMANLQSAREAWSRKEWGNAFKGFASFFTAQLAEWICDYGESVPRVLASMGVVFLVFTLIYGLTGSVVRDSTVGDITVRTVIYDPVNLGIFSLLAMTTSGSPVVGLMPADENVHILTGIQALLGIFLTGLLGYVVGNRIRR